MQLAAVDDLDLPAPLLRSLHQGGLWTIAQLISLDDQTLGTLRFVTPAQVPQIREAITAYWQRIQNYADTAIAPADRRAVVFWLRRQQGTSTAAIAAELDLTVERIYHLSRRGERYIRQREAQRRQESGALSGVWMARSGTPL